MLFRSLLLPTLLTLTTSVNGLLPLYIKGDRFIQPSSPDSLDGEVFSVIGVDYQPGGSSGYDESTGVDALSDPDACLRDTYVFQKLGINTIRIYTLNPDVNHDACMTILNNAGIYVILDVNAGGYAESLNRADPSGSYNGQYLNRVFKFIEAFKDYSNVIGFFSGNEVINDASSASNDGPYIRAVQRDMKEYIEKHSNRTIPVGYSAADDITLRAATFEYLQCNINGTDDDISKSDFFGLNTYEWCGGSTWQTSGYGDLNSTFSNSSIPLFFSEYGCNTVSPRTFDEVTDGLYSGLAYTFSGGLVYEYSQETSNYGLVNIGASNNSVQLLTDFTNLQTQFSEITKLNISSSDVAEADPVECTSDLVTDIDSDFGADFSLPDQPDDIASMISDGVSTNNTGKFIDNYSQQSTNYTIYDVDGSVIDDTTVTFIDSPNSMNLPSSGSSTVASSTSATATSSASASSSASSKAGAAGVAYNGGLLAMASIFWYFI